MSSEQRWRISVKNLQTHLRVGIYEHEKKPQRVLVNAAIECIYPVRPKAIADCFSYEHVYKRVQEWPHRPHTALLETYVTELLDYIFRIDARVVHARVNLCKPDIFPDTESAGVEAEWTRADFERLKDEG